MIRRWAATNKTSDTERNPIHCQLEGAWSASSRVATAAPIAHGITSSPPVTASPKAKNTVTANHAQKTVLTVRLLSKALTVPTVPQ